MSGYLITAEDLRGEALPDDGRALDLALLAEEYIERVTRFRFQAHEAVFALDGTGDGVLGLPQPILSLTSVIADGVTLVEGTDFVAYKSRPPGRDDRRYPRLVRKTTLTAWPDDPVSGAIWTLGQQNVVIDGTFGFTNQIGTAEVAPREVVRAGLRLVALELARIGVDDEVNAAKLRRYLTSFTTGHLEATLSDLAVSGGESGVPEIDKTLRAYTHAERVIVFGGG